MSSLIGTIGPYDEATEEFESYMERMQHLFMINVVEERMKVSLFITLAGPNVYQIVKNLVAPKKPSEYSFEEITNKLLQHFKPAVSEIHERFVFNQCVQKSDQSIAEYIVQIRKLASTCNFGAFLEEAMRDRLVCGIRSENTQKKLLSESNLTFQSACQIAQAAEMAQKQVKTLADSGQTSNVHFVKPKKPFVRRSNVMSEGNSKLFHARSAEGVIRRRSVQQ